MTNPNIESEAELEEGEIEDDGCDGDVIGATVSKSAESTKDDHIKLDEDPIKEKVRTVSDTKTSKKSKYGKEKVAEKKYSGNKSADWTDMLYENMEYEDEDQDDDYYKELEDVKKKLKKGKLRGPYDSPSDDEDDKYGEKCSRIFKKHDSNDEMDAIYSIQRNQADRKSKIPCKFFLEGNCMKGADCSYSHDRNVKFREKDICKTFKATGQCQYGKKCRFIHLEEMSLKNKKDQSRKRNLSSANDAERPSKIPRLFDIDIKVPGLEGQSEEDVGKTLRMAAKRSVTIKATVPRKPSLLGSPPDCVKKQLAAKKLLKKPKIKEDFEKCEAEEFEHNEFESSIASPENVEACSSDKDDRTCVQNYHDIDERQNLTQSGDGVKMPTSSEEELTASHPVCAVNNALSTKALLGDGPPQVPPMNPPRMPLLGNAPPSFNPQMPMFSRPVRHNHPQMISQAIGQAAAMSFFHNYAFQQTRMMNINGLLPHPVNPQICNNFTQRPPFPQNGFNGLNNGPMLMNSKNQFLPGSQPLPVNVSIENVPQPLLNQSISSPLPDPFLLQNPPPHSNAGLLSARSPPASQLEISSTGINRAESTGNFPSDSIKRTDEGRPQIQSKTVDVASSVTACGKEGSDNAFGGTVKSSDLDSNRLEPVESSNVMESVHSDDLGSAKECIVGGINVKSLSHEQREIYLKMFQVSKIEPLPVVSIQYKETVKDCEEVTENSSETPNEASATQSSSNESMSVSLTVANEVSFDCKLNGPYCLQVVDVWGPIRLPHFVNPQDSKWASDPRVQKHKNDPIILPKSTAAEASVLTNPVSSISVSCAKTVASKPAPVATNRPISNPSLMQTRDPRLLRRTKKQNEAPLAISSTSVTNSTLSSQSSLESEGQSNKPGELEPLSDFLKRYSSLPLSELNVASVDSAETIATENSSSLKKPYQNVVIKKSSNNGQKAKLEEDLCSDKASLPDSKRFKKSNQKNTMEFQSPLMSPTYPPSALHYGLPFVSKPAEPLRLDPSAKSFDKKETSTFYAAREASKPPVTADEESLFVIPTTTTATGSIKSIFKSIDPTASPFC